ncbi:MAG: protein translocase subunit SecD, partial [Candidatus Stygibacter frigidus]|nr:protein translocase subunit SecD [Candidatus Stygibacter frigidus]
MRNRKLRSLLIMAVLVFTVYFVAPLLFEKLPSFWTDKELKLGLDLQGGMQILLEVDYSELELSVDAKKDAVKTALEIIRNRIDQFGVSEPSIQPIGENRILIQLPGLKNFNRAKELIGKTALLEFKLVAEQDQVEEVYNDLDSYLEKNYQKYPYLADLDLVEAAPAVDVLSDEDSLATDEESANSKLFTALVSNDEAPGRVPYKNINAFKTLLKDEDFVKQIPAGLQLALEKISKKDPYSARILYVLHSQAELSGDKLDKASTKIGQGYNPKTNGKPYVSLEFNKEGARIFKTVTGQNIKRRLAIVLDDVVYVAPVIQDKIPSGQAQITGSFSLDEVQDLVIVLESGNLPAPVKVIEERTVGPSLGNDSIRAGVRAALLGLALVVVFMIIYYGLSGIVAVIALLMNMGFILAVLTSLQGTLTMPGIAGLILTIGMSVDANVIIFERIREEMKAGKTIRSAVDAGFSRALVTILDANITTLITALV